MNRTTHTQTTFAIETHGCKLNQADTLILAREFTQAGFVQVDDTQPADVYVLNTCTVTHVADRKARQALRAARRRNPSATIVAAGCYPQRSPDDLRLMDEVDLIFGNTHKPTLVRQVLEWCGEPTVPCAIGDQPDFQTPRFTRTRAMVKIQEGCNQVCAYCIVPKVRGRERSIPADTIIGEIQRFTADGYNEVVLTGTQLGSYGFEWQGASLAGLIERILAETDVPRLRVSSLQPQEMSPQLLHLWDDERLCPHFHLPLQSGSDAILERMRRRYTAAQYAESVERIRHSIPAAAITADVIVGFPGETDADFMATYNLCEQMAFADMHAFPYSIRPGTSAAHFHTQLHPQSKSERMRALLRLAESQMIAFRQNQLGTTRPVLWETQISTEGGSQWSGLTDNYIRVRTDSQLPLMNTITLAVLASLHNGIVYANPSP